MGRRRRYSSWKRKKLWEENPRCYLCGRMTVLEIPEDGALPPETATLDHLRPRHHPARRVMPRNNERRIELACSKCNNERDRRETAALPREYLWEKSDSLPLRLREFAYVLDAYRRNRKSDHDRKRVLAELIRRGALDGAA